MIDPAALGEVLHDVLPAATDQPELDAIAERILALDKPEPRRFWHGEALAAYDQGLASIPDGEWGSPDFWISRAQAAAAIASAEQARIANLIAWKQLQATRSSSRDLGVDLMPLADPITDTIEEGLGIA